MKEPSHVIRKERDDMPPTLIAVADVAQRARLPYSRVWRHLHGGGTRLSPQEKARIDEAIRELRRELLERLLAEDAQVEAARG